MHKLTNELKEIEEHKLTTIQANHDLDVKKKHLELCKIKIESIQQSGTADVCQSLKYKFDDTRYSVTCFSDFRSLNAVI